MGGGHVWEAGRGLLPCRGGEGSQRACYPAHLKRALEPAVLGCVKCGNFPPLMYNLELIQSYTTVASPSLKECRILMLENEVEGKVSVCERLGLRAMA